jgi:hypothetical protein
MSRAPRERKKVLLKLADLIEQHRTSSRSWKRSIAASRSAMPSMLIYRTPSRRLLACGGIDKIYDQVSPNRPMSYR